MNIIRLSYPLSSEIITQPCAVAMGYFDGVHLGHRRVIQRAIDFAKANGLKSGVLTFFPHPREVLGRSGYSQYITPLEDKLEQFEKMGIDFVYIIDFDIAFSSVYPEDYVEEVLMPLQVKHIVVGFDNTFAYRGMGTTQTLQELSKGRYSVDVVGPVNRLGEKVSSTIIREYLHNGEVDQVRHLLGRPYSIKGVAVHGDKRGRKIGFPTANIGVSSPYLIGKNGVYGVKAKVDGKIYDGVMNIGIKPTFELEKKEKTLEVHIFGFDQEIYGKDIEVELLFMIREEQKFSGVEALINQIQKDAEFAKKKFASIL
ncbi:riboflavin biosynthesis protein RibF [Brevibacillus daliensis]|uniref:riboflavin biosynthesis protein RibF n=1 Tax=Brevibacillus daliensis TaxID=2892995 RepID=UPI001E2AF61E|nr:riboflavin biosynthesis protein RibF [Brevibacillus daliensis]